MLRVSIVPTPPIGCCPTSYVLLDANALPRDARNMLSLARFRERVAIQRSSSTIDGRVPAEIPMGGKLVYAEQQCHNAGI